MTNGEINLSNSENDRILRDLFREASIEGDWRRPDAFRSLGKSPQVEVVVEELDTDAIKLEEIMSSVDESFADIKAIPAREEIQKQKERLEMIDTRIALLDAECTKANADLQTTGQDLKEKISEKKQSVHEALEKKDAAIAKFEELEAELQSVPEIVAKGLQELLEDIALQSISEVHTGLGNLGQRSLGSHDIAVKILHLRSAKAVMVNAITHWEVETQSLETLKSDRTRLITTAEALKKKLDEEKKLREQYTNHRVVPAGHLITETTRRDRFANTITGLGASSVGWFLRKQPRQITRVQTQLIAGVEQNGGI